MRLIDWIVLFCSLCAIVVGVLSLPQLLSRNRAEKLPCRKCGSKTEFVGYLGSSSGEYPMYKCTACGEITDPSLLDHQQAIKHFQSIQQGGSK